MIGISELAYDEVPAVPTDLLGLNESDEILSSASETDNDVARMSCTDSSAGTPPVDEWLANLMSNCLVFPVEEAADRYFQALVDESNDAADDFDYYDDFDDSRAFASDSVPSAAPRSSSDQGKNKRSRFILQ